MTGGAAQAVFRGLIVCGGDPPPPWLLAEEEARADLVVYTDGAACGEAIQGRRIDVVIGDMDSIATPVPGVRIVDCGPHSVQENSDSEKAVLHVISAAAESGLEGPNHVIVRMLGADGGRIDHTLANVLLSARYAASADVRLVGGSWELWAVEGRRELGLGVGTAVSLLPLAVGVHITTYGLRWPLDEVVEPGSRGLSNEVVVSNASIDVAGGSVIVVALTTGQAS